MTKCCTDHISINTSSKKAPKIDPRNKLRGKLKCRMRCLIGGGKFCYPTSLVAARNPPNKGIHPMILNLKNTHTYYAGHRPLCLHNPPPEVDSSRLSGLQPHPQGVGAHSLSRGPQGVPPSRSVLTREPRRASLLGHWVLWPGHWVP